MIPYVAVLLLLAGLARAAQPATPASKQPSAPVTAQAPVIQLPQQSIPAQLTQPPQPVAVKVVSAPADTSADRLVVATWVLVIANAALCFVTFFGARRQSTDMRESIGIARDAANAASRSAEAAHRSADSAMESARLAEEQRRWALERETNITAHRVIQTSDRVKQLAVNLIGSYQELWATSGRGGSPQLLAPVQTRAEKRCEFAKERADAAQTVLGIVLAQKPDALLAIELQRLDEILVQLEAMKDEIGDEKASVRDNIRTTRESIQSGGGRLPPPLA